VYPGFERGGLSFYRFFIYGAEACEFDLHLSNPLQRNSICKKSFIVIHSKKDRKREKALVEVILQYKLVGIRYKV